MKTKFKLDENLLPQVIIRCRNGAPYMYGEKRYSAIKDIPGYDDCTINGKRYLIYSQGSRIRLLYLKYQESIDALECRVITKNTNIKGSHEWKDYSEPFLVLRDKTSLFVNSKRQLPRKASTCNAYIVVNDYCSSDTIHAVSNALRSFSWEYGSLYTNEVRKFIGKSYTIRTKTYEVEYVWNLTHWLKTNQIDPETKRQSKKEIQFQQYLSYPLKDIKVDTLYDEALYMVIPKIVFEKVNDELEVMRYFTESYHDTNLKERYRIYIPKTGDICAAGRVGNKWSRLSRFPYIWENRVMIVNPDYLKDSVRLKYYADFLDYGSERRYGERVCMAEFRVFVWLPNLIRHFELEQLAKLGYPEYALDCALSDQPMANLRNIFGIKTLSKNKKPLLKKLGLTRQQLAAYLDALKTSGERCVTRWNHISGLDDIAEIESLKDMPADRLKWYATSLGEFKSRYWGQKFLEPLNSMDDDNRKNFFKNLMRIAKRYEPAVRVAADAMNTYNRLSNPRPEIDWEFKSASDLVRVHDSLVELQRIAEEERQRAIAEARAKEDAKYEKQMKELDEKRKANEFEDDEFIIRLPKSPQEIVEEGLIQHICIGGFVQRHAVGATNLYFLRKKDCEDKPLYAIEVNNAGKVEQIHGFGNRWLGNNPEAIPTVIRFLRQNHFSCDKVILTSTATGYSNWNATCCELPIVDGVAYAS